MSTSLPQPGFLPMSRAEMADLGWDELDVLLVSGDAYIDHPAHGVALLGRWLVAHGWRVGVVAQPRWSDPADIAALGRPRLFAGVSAGALDSMVAHYTAFRKKRSEDAYTPGGRAGARPNRATIVYTGLVRRAFPGLPVAIGGIEASLRRVSHYDFWQDKLRRSILLDAKADLLLYGMAERTVVELAARLEVDPEASLAGLAGTVVAGSLEAVPDGAEVVRLPAHEELEADPRKLMDATLTQERQVHHADFWCVQSAAGRDVLVAPPGAPLEDEELDTLFVLPFTRRAHPAYAEPVPGLETVRDSITSHRGCGGGCSFCSLALHQGRRVRSRSRASILDEAARMAGTRGFSGSISDVGGPSANMWGARCALGEGRCSRVSCMVPNVCPHFDVDQTEGIELLRAVGDVEGVRHVRVASGVRFDLGLTEPEALSAYVREFTGGQLKVAPEHVCNGVLTLMRKPGREVFERFLTFFERESGRAAKEQYVVPYLLSGFPGTTDEDMRELGRWLADRGWRPRQVQCFIPTPGTVATAMFYGGIDPKGRPIHVARTDAERLRQHAILMPTRGRPPGKGSKPPRKRPKAGRGPKKR